MYVCVHVCECVCVCKLVWMCVCVCVRVNDGGVRVGVKQYVCACGCVCACVCVLPLVCAITKLLMVVDVHSLDVRLRVPGFTMVEGLVQVGILWLNVFWTVLSTAGEFV